MNKGEFTQRMQEVFEERNLDLNASQSAKAVDAVFDTIQTTLADGEGIAITGFGTFEVRERAARTGRNPKTGESVNVKDKFSPHFKPGKELKERVDAINS